MDATPIHMNRRQDPRYDMLHYAVIPLVLQSGENLLPYTLAFANPTNATVLRHYRNASRAKSRRLKNRSGSID